jgi:hypothetical protein
MVQQALAGQTHLYRGTGAAREERKNLISLDIKHRSYKKSSKIT